MDTHKPGAADAATMQGNWTLQLKEQELERFKYFQNSYFIIAFS